MEYTWKDMLKDSSWVTIAWEWLQSLLGRTVDFILWVTMIFACYQLIPGAPMPTQGVSVFMFVMQFIALDIGGMSLNQIGQRHGLHTWSYTRVVAYACIFVTLVTIVFAGIEHAIVVPKDVSNWVEVSLVIARSVLTVLYGQAVRAIKTVEQTEDDRVAALEEEASNLRSQLDTEQKRASNLQSQLDTKQKEVSNLSVQLDVLKMQLDGKRQELESIKETFTTGQEWQENRAQQLLEAEQRRVSSLQEQLDTERGKLFTVQQEVSKLRLQLDTERAKSSNLQEKMNGQRVSSVQPKASSVQSGGVQLDTKEKEQNSSENTIESQIRALLAEEPGLSARAIASKIGCSPTTASTWKKAIEQELSIVPRLHVVNE
jgi:hypothetical protein